MGYEIIRFPFRNMPGVRVANTEVELISALLRATGAGKVYLQTSRLRENNPQYAACWLWVAERINDLKDIVRQCAPYSLKLQALKEIP